MRSVMLFFGALLVTSTPALADTLENFLPPKEGATACFRRIYDAGHLEKHKDQTVTEIRFRIAYAVFWDEEYGEQARYYAFQLLAKRRGDDRELKTSGTCSKNSEGRIFCGVECDGGGLYFEPRSAQSIVLEFGDSDGILMSASCSEDENTEVLRPGKDDKSFRLDRLPSTHCAARADW